MNQKKLPELGPLGPCWKRFLIETGKLESVEWDEETKWNEQMMRTLAKVGVNGNGGSEDGNENVGGRGVGSSENEKKYKKTPFELIVCLNPLNEQYKPKVPYNRMWMDATRNKNFTEKTQEYLIHTTYVYGNEVTKGIEEWITKYGIGKHDSNYQKMHVDVAYFIELLRIAHVVLSDSSSKLRMTLPNQIQTSVGHGTGPIICGQSGKRSFKKTLCIPDL